MKVKIYICEYEPPERTLHTELFQSMISGRPSSPECISDLDGKNISDANEFSELRHQFYVWKNRLHELDYVGFEHYRRVLLIDPLPADSRLRRDSGLYQIERSLLATHQRIFAATTTQFDAYWSLRRAFNSEDVDRIKTWIGSSDIITVRPDDANIEHTWRKHHIGEQWQIIVDAIRSAPYFARRECHVDFESSRGYYNNIYIMKNSLFDEYMAFLFSVCEQLKSTLPQQQDRMFGYVGERIFSCWIHQKRVESPLLRVAEVPMLFHQPTTSAG